jgi:HEAT repeat protein
VVSQGDGTVALKEGDKTVASFVPKTAKDQRGAAALHTFTASGHTLVEVRIPLLGDGPKREEIWIAERSSAGTKPLQTIWWNVAGARDADGETALVVKASDQGIEEYQTAARLSRCDGAPVPLFRRTWNFATRAFQNTLPELPARAATKIQAHRGGAPEGKPVGGFFFSAASGSSGADHDAAKLRPPVAVNDSNPATVWSSEGDGRGQMLTARSSGGFPIIGLRLLPGDTSSEKAFRASAKPHRLSLIFGRDPSQNADVEMVEDADLGARRLREPYWIALPKPVTSTCVTVVVRETTSDKSPLSIADLEVMTELDGPQAADRLVADLAKGTSCVSRQPLLVRLGPPALAKVAAAIPQAGPGAGRECLVGALAALVAAGAKPSADMAVALVAAMDRSSPDEEKAILKLLPELADAPTAAIAAVLSDDKRSDEDRTRAARVLSAMKQPEASAKVLDTIGRGSPSLRKALRTIAAGAAGPPLAAVLAALDATPAAESARRADLLLIVGALATRDHESRPAALAALRTPLHGPSSFEEQARAIQSLGLLHDPAATDELVNVRAHHADGVMRSFAVSELANAEGAAVLPALRAALDDADPRVREIASERLGRQGDKDAAKLIIEGAKQEPWPRVRRAEIVALGELCVAEGNDLLVRAFQRDVEEVRQAALAGIARCYGVKATGTLLRTLGRLAETADMRSLAARLLGERKDPRTVPGLAEVLTRLLTESQADLSLEAVIADSAMALATIHGDQAVATLVGLLSDARPSVQRIAIDALGMVCDPGAGQAALHKAATSKDEAVSIPAAAAEANCRERH